MGTHYICTGGCKGVSESSGACQAADCLDYEKPLKECNCTDGLHGLTKPSSNGDSGETGEPT